MALVSEEQVIKVLQHYNQWWKEPEKIQSLTKPQKRVAYNEAMKFLTHPSIRRFVVLSGARRVGKTTIMFQMIEDLLKQGVAPRNILYITFDNPLVKLISIDDVLNIYESLYPIEGKKYLFFDEVQYTNNWELWMKVLYDSRQDICLTATGSASPIIQKGAADSGAGRWTMLKIPTLSFYEYCELLQLKERPALNSNIHLSELANLTKGEFAELANVFSPLVQHFNRYLLIGGFPELVLSDDDTYAQRLLREDVVDKVIKRDVLTLFNVRNPLLMEKLFLYLCINSSGIFNAQTATKELGNISVTTLENYLEFLEKSNLIYRSNPIDVGSKGALKGRPKIYVADPAIRNAVLMIDNVQSNEREMGIMVETAVFKHFVSFYEGKTAKIGYFRKLKDNQKEVDVVIDQPAGKVLCEVKYRNDSSVLASDAVVTLASDPNSQVTSAFIATKKLTDYGASNHDTQVPVVRIPALILLYLLGKAD
ncbi:putative ATPase (AAA+ superfamily) [Desulfitobacterium dichloroeliminans LMG P-21439]|uniref:Putative ATPase (AAA+ superfamily) n=1 Tax=Desulfitobacterium dichloroeliminans (strain LMG P-21439 / DCA1) TaxID=871963 RepID=L0FBN8_DESDL|nr:ATP-binding protein [Desulfitobacterium dichloroeliminans]AGA70627.1 putative ATPase (AAA+ superfamily) [Desulfitobacterium dichloroeliminans LMG P-21439]